MITHSWFATARRDVYTNGDPCYVAEAANFDGCVGYGSTPEEAIESLKRAIAAIEAVRSGTVPDFDDATAGGPLTMDIISANTEWMSGAGVSIPS